LQHHQRRDHGEHDDDRTQRRPRAVHVRGPPRQQVRDPEEQGQLGQLRRLDRQRADADPAGGAVGADTDARDEHEDQQDEGHQHERPGHAPPPVVVDMGHDDERHPSGGRPGRLADDVIPG
jgi:hypothetical protein